MQDDWYVPPPWRPLEADFRGEGLERCFLHFDGLVGQPASAVLLFAGCGATGSRVVVQTADLAADVEGMGRRASALARLRDLAGLGLPPGGWGSLEDEAATDRWARSAFEVDGQRYPAVVIQQVPELWCVLGATRELEVTVFGTGSVPDRIRLRSVSDWSPYGVAWDSPRALAAMPLPPGSAPLG